METALQRPPKQLKKLEKKRKDVIYTSNNSPATSVVMLFYVEAPEMFHWTTKRHLTFHRHDCEKIMTEIPLLGELLL